MLEDKSQKQKSWPRLARPRDLVDSLVWRSDDRATEFSLSKQTAIKNTTKKALLKRAPTPLTALTPKLTTTRWQPPRAWGCSSCSFPGGVLPCMLPSPAPGGFRY